MAAPASGHAQERPFPYALGDVDRIIAPAALASSALGLYLADRADPITLAEITALDRWSVNGLDRGATQNWSPAWQDRSDWFNYTLIGAAGLLCVAPHGVDGRLSETVTLGTIFAETLSLVVGATYITKALAGRARPYAYNTSLTPDERYAIAGPDDPKVRFSFFSGHTATSFAAATLLSTLYTDLHGPSTTSRIVWGASLSLASLTGYARIQGGVHFPTDVFVGAAVGAAIGYLVPALHRTGAHHPVSVSAGPAGVRLRLAVGGR